MTAQFVTTSDLNLTPYNMATSTIKMLDIEDVTSKLIEDVTSKLTFDALTKRAVKIGDIVFFQAEIYFSTYIGEYTYTLGVDASIRPTSISAQPLSAVMVDGGFTPKQPATCFIASNGLQWRVSAQNGNYLLISGWWKLN